MVTQRHLRIFNNCAELLYESKPQQSFKVSDTPKYLFLKRNFSAGEIWKVVVPACTAVDNIVLQDFLIVYTSVWTLELYQVADKTNIYISNHSSLRIIIDTCASKQELPCL